MKVIRLYAKQSRDDCLTSLGITNGQVADLVLFTATSQLTSNAASAPQLLRENSQAGLGIFCLKPSIPMNRPVPVVLSAFKRAIPQWSSLPLDNAVLELWADSPTLDATVVREECAFGTAGHWGEILTEWFDCSRPARGPESNVT